MGRLALLSLLVVLVLAGCGGTSLYSVDKSRACLESENAHIGSKVDFIASTATGGAFMATLPDNFVTIAFGATTADASETAIGYQRFAFPNVRNNIQDVLERYGNVVLLWHKHPANADLALVTGCLK